MNAMRTVVLSLVLAAAAGFAPVNSFARVVINEVMYHAPDDLDDLEYIELFNSSDAAVDVGGWSLAKGVKVKFAPGTKIGGKGFIVVARNAKRLADYYGIQPLQVFSQKLKNNGERGLVLHRGGIGGRARPLSPSGR